MYTSMRPQINLVYLQLGFFKSWKMSRNIGEKSFPASQGQYDSREIRISIFWVGKNIKKFLRFFYDFFWKLSYSWSNFENLQSGTEKVMILSRILFIWEIALIFFRLQKFLIPDT